MSIGPWANRFTAIQQTLQQIEIEGLLLGVGPDLRWVSGYAPYLLERLTLLIVPRTGRPHLIVPALERPGAAACPAVVGGLSELLTWEESEDPYQLVSAVLGPGAKGGTLLVSDHLWAMFVIGLQETFPDAHYGLASDAIRSLRMVKDSSERALLAAAAEAADTVFDQIPEISLVGRTEREVSRVLKDRLTDAGLDADVYAIVASGENSAVPHHGAGARRIEAGEPIMFDIGGSRLGYHADATRMFWVTGGSPSGEPNPEYLRLYETLRRAQTAAKGAARAGVSCESIDAAARDIIAADGFGPQFIHRTGHGIGLDLHEHPYIVAGNTDEVAEGHSFSIEPGIYFAGKYGARIEDIVICESDGVTVLNNASRDLRIVPG